MQALHVLNGVVVNLIEVESLSSFTPEEGGSLFAVPEEGIPPSIGWLYNEQDGFYENPEDAISRAKNKRDTLLQESDINVLPDRWAAMPPEQQALWSIYRQLLRDLPLQPSFPETINWPLKP